MITIFYGEMGSGKSCAARKYADMVHAPFFEGDDVVTPAMRKCILFRPIPRAVLEDFLFNHFVPEVVRRAFMERDLVVSQALYSRTDRLRIKSVLQSHGHEAKFVLVNIPLRQLLSRPMGFRWVYYWLLTHFFFQKDDNA